MSNLCVCNQLRLEGYLTDAVIRIQDVEFKIHKIILCNCSPYFRTLFTSWSKSDRRVYEIPGMSPDMMQLIIEFAYTGNVSVTEDSVQELLLAADQLIVIDVIQACWDFLEERLSPENCIGIWQFTDICPCPKLQHKAYHYIVNNFEEVALSEEVLHLSVDNLADILARDDLNVRNERSVFKAVHQWVAHAPEGRQNHLVLLLSKVRLALISEDFININVKLNELVSSNTECLRMVEDALQIQDLMRQNIPPLYAVGNTVARPRLPQAILLAIGGWSGNDPTNCIEAYDFRTDFWINVESHLERPRAYHGTVVYNSCFYCLGGFDQVEYFNSVCKFDLSTHTWHDVAPMYFRRCYVSTVLLNRYIYAMGGYDGHIRLNTAERYRPETNQWTIIAPMNERRSDASSTTLHNKIYICGGFNGLSYLNTCEYYHPGTNQWTTIAPMGTHRSGIGVVAYAGDIYAVGGFDGRTRLRSAESYNPETNTWSPVPSMLTPRSNFGIEVIEDRLFVAGGFNGISTTSKVEYYDADTREWFEACEMGIFRSALSCCVVSDLPNMAEYTVPRDTLPRFQMALGW